MNSGAVLSRSKVPEARPANAEDFARHASKSPVKLAVMLEILKT
jgi:hypothetical protein